MHKQNRQIGKSKKTVKAISEDNNIAIFKENTKIVKSLFDNYANITFGENDAIVSDSLKFYPARIANDTLNKTNSLVGLKAFRSLSNKVSYSDLKFLPTVNDSTYQPDGNVRVFATWTTEGKNGVKITSKYFGIFEFNKDHKVFYIEEYQDYGGLMLALTTIQKK